MSDVCPWEPTPDWHAAVTIQLGELIQAGLFDWENDKSLVWDYYDEEQYKRVCEKIVNRFFYREIGVLPYGAWKLAYMRKMTEVMPKYKQAYRFLDEGADTMSTADEYGKSRDIFSDFPATMLGDNQDYASTGNDRQHETIYRGDWIEKTEELFNRYNDIDVLILNELEPLFSCLMSVSINGI